MFCIDELKRYEKWFKNKEGSKVDYFFKSFCLNNHIDKEVNKITWNLYCNDFFEQYGLVKNISYSTDTLKLFYDSLADKFGFLSILESLKINNARYHRSLRLKSRVESIINHNTSFFLTLTFTNDTLNRTQAHIRRKYVTRYLKSISNDYLANIDFGKRNHREHYHAIVNCDFIDSKLWKYGNLDFELINNSESIASELLSKYVSKLGNHAIKETCKRNHLIYPKIKR